MTPSCIDTVLEMERDFGPFADLSVEQLLYACIKSVGEEETQRVLESMPEELERLGVKYGR